MKSEIPLSFKGSGEIHFEPSNIPEDSIEEYTRYPGYTEWPSISSVFQIIQEEADAFLDLFEDPDWPNVLT